MEVFLKRLAILELNKLKPVGAVYNYYCQINNVPIDEDYITAIQKYEKEVLSKRK